MLITRYRVLLISAKIKIFRRLSCLSVIFRECDNCKFSICTSGLNFYYVDKLGQRQRHRHYARSRETINASGINGFTVEWYCSKCHSLRETVVLQFDHPENGPVAAFIEYWNNLKSENKDFEIVCSKCGSELFDDLTIFLVPNVEKASSKNQADLCHI